MDGKYTAGAAQTMFSEITIATISGQLTVIALCASFTRVNVLPPKMLILNQKRTSPVYAESHTQHALEDARGDREKELCRSCLRPFAALPVAEASLA